MAVGACSPRSGPASQGEASGTDALRPAIDGYYRGFRDFDATSTMRAVSPDILGTYPPVPEGLKSAMITAARREGRLLDWSVMSGTVDEGNGQAFMKIRATTDRMIYVSSMELRLVQGEWRVYSVRRVDSVANPSARRQLPSVGISPHGVP